jgi:hypothetical protein
MPLNRGGESAHKRLRFWLGLCRPTRKSRLCGLRRRLDGVLTREAPWREPHLAQPILHGCQVFQRSGKRDRLIRREASSVSDRVHGLETQPGVSGHRPDTRQASADPRRLNRMSRSCLTTSSAVMARS